MLIKRDKKNEKLIQSFGNIKDDSFDFEQIENYFRKKDKSTSFQTLSDKTCNDLDFEELFMFVDRTSSKVGQQYLYNKLRTIAADSIENELDEKLINQFTDNPDFRVTVQNHLTKLDKREAYYISSLFQEEHIQRPKWYFIIPLLSFTSLFSLIMSFFNPKLILVLLGVFVVNLAIHYWNKKNLYQYLGSIPQLLKLNNIACELFRQQPLKE